jgi:large subunit ribosomal protein L21
MFAVIKTGGKQYKVAKNDVISVEKLQADPGATIAFDQVLLIGDGKGQKVGAPVVEGASVTATVLEQTRGDKIIVFKKKRRKNYRRTAGHRQYLTVLRIADILPAPEEKAAAEPKVKPKPAAKAAPARKAKPKETAVKAKKARSDKTAAAKTPAKKTASKKAASKAKN